MASVALICDAPAVTFDTVALVLLTLRVAPVRFVPASMTGIVAPGVPPDGDNDKRAGAGGFTVNGRPRSAPGIITVRGPNVALAAIFKVAVSSVAVRTRLLTVTPTPVTVRPAELRFVPVIFNGTLLLITPLFWEIDVRRGLVGVSPSRCALTTSSGLPVPWQFAQSSFTAPESILSCSALNDAPFCSMCVLVAAESWQAEQAA